MSHDQPESSTSHSHPPHPLNEEESQANKGSQPETCSQDGDDEREEEESPQILDPEILLDILVALLNRARIIEGAESARAPHPPNPQSLHMETIADLLIRIATLEVRLEESAGIIDAQSTQVADLEAAYQDLAEQHRVDMEETLREALYWVRYV